ncbi:C45 family autoproteolytic acyltransferase/hydolase [Micrococcus sp. IITD107]|uniref:C45 family autoproteolytic acyltransferase/hydolase n=1 Tax=Micrococcus sp. IITD107 TaxID=3342790 RepID=UPI0035BB934C
MSAEDLPTPANHQPRIVRVTGADARECGAAWGQAIRAEVSTTLTRYRELFRESGIDDDAAEQQARLMLGALEQRFPELHAELGALALGAEIGVEELMLIIGRTEILSMAPGIRPGECSTLIDRGHRLRSVQTWDWHVEMTDGWHLIHHASQSRRYAALAEFGQPAKIGINDAGVGVHLNVLGHRRDGSQGVPIHALIAGILGGADSVAHALEMMRATPVGASSCITVVDSENAAMVEFAAGEMNVLKPKSSVWVHTNHFLTPSFSADERSELYQPDSDERMALLMDRIHRGAVPVYPEDLSRVLISHAGEAALCCRPNPALPFGQRWATLATVVLEPAARQMSVASGSPAEAADDDWITLNP